MFIQISTDVSSALKIFETINERGVGLDSMDLLKNLLFTRVDSKQFTLLKDEWKKITVPLEKGKEKSLRFLRYFLMATYDTKNKRGDTVVREDKIYDWFVDEDNAAKCNYKGNPFGFVRTIISNVNHYIAFANGMGNDGKPNSAMNSLRLLAGRAFSLHYILLLAAAKFPKALFDHFVSQLECYLFYYLFTKTSTRELERNFSQWADELRAITEDVEPAKQKNRLNAFVAEHFESSMKDKSLELTDALKRFSLRTVRKYRAQYLLARLTQYVEIAFTGSQKPLNLELFINPLEIEHILPNAPSPDLRVQWERENPDATYDDYKDRLGNLTLLEKPINSSIGNASYAEKKTNYRNSGNYLTRSLVELADVGQNTSISRINEKLAAFSGWNAQSIEKRHELLIALAKDVWKTTPI